MKTSLDFVVYAKSAKTEDGRDFKRFFTALPDGEVVALKFTQNCDTPKIFPCDISVKKGNCNLAKNHYDKILEDGTVERRESRTLWIKNYDFIGEHIDTSMDEYYNESTVEEIPE